MHLSHLQYLASFLQLQFYSTFYLITNILKWCHRWCCHDNKEKHFQDSAGITQSICQISIKSINIYCYSITKHKHHSGCLSFCFEVQAKSWFLKHLCDTWGVVFTHEVDSTALMHTCLLIFLVPWNRRFSWLFIFSNENTLYTQRGPQQRTHPATCRSICTFIVQASSLVIHLLMVIPFHNTNPYLNYSIILLLLNTFHFDCHYTLLIGEKLCCINNWNNVWLPTHGLQTLQLHHRDHYHALTQT